MEIEYKKHCSGTKPFDFMWVFYSFYPDWKEQDNKLKKSGIR